MLGVCERGIVGPTKSFASWPAFQGGGCGPGFLVPVDQVCAAVGGCGGVLVRSSFGSFMFIEWVG